MLLSISRDITNERNSKSEGSFTCLEECFEFHLILWYVFEIHGEVQAFWLARLASALSVYAEVFVSHLRLAHMG